MTTFIAPPLPPLLQEKLATAEFPTPASIQDQTIPHALAGKDVIATAQPGTGKPLAFLIPLIEMLQQQPLRQVHALVLLPTRELAMQVNAEYEKLRSRNLPKSALVIGGLSEKPQIAAVRAVSRLGIATPGGRRDFLPRHLVVLRQVQTVAPDDAVRLPAAS